MGYAAFIASSCSTATQRAVKCSGFPASIDSAGVAQLVEQRIRNAKVVGSTPISGTNRAKCAIESSISRSHPMPFGCKRKRLRVRASNPLNLHFANATGANGSTRLGPKNEAARALHKPFAAKAAGQPPSFQGQLPPTADRSARQCVLPAHASQRATRHAPADLPA